MSRNKEHRGTAFGHWGLPPKAAAPLGLCSLFLIIYVINIYGYSLYIPFIFPKYVPHDSLCVFLNLFIQQKKNLV